MDDLLKRADLAIEDSRRIREAARRQRMLARFTTAHVRKIIATTRPTPMEMAERYPAALENPEESKT